MLQPLSAAVVRGQASKRKSHASATPAPSSPLAALAPLQVLLSSVLDSSEVWATCLWPALQVLLHEHLPHGRVYQYQDGFQDSHSDISGVSSSDLLEYVDKSSGFTPLIAAIYYHKKTAVELVSQALDCTWACT